MNYESNLRKFGFPVKNKTVLESYKQKNLNPIEKITAETIISQLQSPQNMKKINIFKSERNSRNLS